MNLGGFVSGLRLGLQTRLTLLLSLAVLLTVGLAWMLTGRTVLGPPHHERFDADVAEVQKLAARLDAGESVEVLSDSTDSALLFSRSTPGMVRRSRRGDGRCREHPIKGRRMTVCGGPAPTFAVEVSKGWLVYRKVFDFEEARRRILLGFLAVAALVIAICAVIASVVMRPLQTSIDAMERMADGDLSHRLGEGGPTEMGEAARAFNRMADRVTSLLESERSLMASISHELRTPLARLRLELELLRDRDLPAKRLDAMEGDVHEIDRLIGEVLESSRLSIGERVLAQEPVDLRAVVEEAIGQQPLARHELRLEGDALPVRGDHNRLVRVMRNLLENAGKYAPPDTTVSVLLDGKTVRVLDQGPGVSASDLPRLFEPFYRGDRGRRTGATGYGLGLMIIKQIIELHGGTVTAQNRDPATESGGLEIAFTLP